MKKNELLMLEQLNKHFPQDKPILCENEYHRFDAYNNNYIIELKYRHKTYDEFIIEFDKYAYNKLYSEMYGKKFLYVVGVEDNIFIFNISNLDLSGYNYRWEMRPMPKQTEFDKNYKIDKLVGYLERWAGKGVKDGE
jgi:hypothetical protein